LILDAFRASFWKIQMREARSAAFQLDRDLANCKRILIEALLRTARTLPLITKPNWRLLLVSRGRDQAGGWERDDLQIGNLIA
jgi:hypothetical protein